MPFEHPAKGVETAQIVQLKADLDRNQRVRMPPQAGSPNQLQAAHRRQEIEASGGLQIPWLQPGVSRLADTRSPAAAKVMALLLSQEESDGPVVEGRLDAVDAGLWKPRLRPRRLTMPTGPAGKAGAAGLVDGQGVEGRRSGPGSRHRRKWRQMAVAGEQKVGAVGRDDPKPGRIVGSLKYWRATRSDLGIDLDHGHAALGAGGGR